MLSKRSLSLLCQCSLIIIFLFYSLFSDCLQPMRGCSSGFCKILLKCILSDSCRLSATSFKRSNCVCYWLYEHALLFTSALTSDIEPPLYVYKRTMHFRATRTSGNLRTSAAVLAEESVACLPDRSDMSDSK